MDAVVFSSANFQWKNSLLIYFRGCMDVKYLHRFLVLLALLVTIAYIIFSRDVKTNTRRELWYQEIPVQAIYNAYNRVNFPSAKMQRILVEKERWKKDWNDFVEVHESTFRPGRASMTLERVKRGRNGYKKAMSEFKSAIPDTQKHSAPDGPTLIIYNYYETKLNKENLEFFLRHHRQKLADVIIIVNGDKISVNLPEWVIKIFRPNIGMEFCAMMEVLPLLLFDLSFKRYQYFMLLNASVRGPFYPLWPNRNANWVDVFKGQLSEDTWLVGTSFNCMMGHPSLFHLQSFTLMTHRKGLELIYEDFQKRLLILEVNNNSCSTNQSFRIEKDIVPMHKMSVVFAYEIGISQTFLSRNIGIRSIVLGWQSLDLRNVIGVQKICMEQEDQYYREAYFGGDMSPFETIFIKTNTADAANENALKRVDSDLVAKYSIWFDQRVDTAKI